MTAIGFVTRTTHGGFRGQLKFLPRRVISKKMIGGEHVSAQPFVQSFEPPAGATNPASQRRALQFDTVARKDLRLAIERSVVAIRRIDFAGVSASSTAGVVKIDLLSVSLALPLALVLICARALGWS